MDKIRSKSGGLIVLALLLLSLSGCGKRSGEGVVTTPSVESETTKVTAVICEANQEQGSITFFDIAASMNRTWSFHKGTSIQNQQGREISAQRLIAGEVVELVYDENREWITSIQLSDQVTRYEHLKHYTLDMTERTLATTSQTYRFTDNLVIASNNRLIDWLDISNVDELTICYQKEKIVSVIVTKGHGTIRPTNYDGFIGGMVSVGNVMARPVTKDMILVVPEGEYDVTMKNGTISGSKSLAVTRDQEVALDMAEFKQTPDNVGQVIFEIEPAGADLYLNGRRTEFSKPVPLNYGEHRVQVVLTGYETYIGTIDVKDANPTVTIQLAEEAEEPEESTTPSPAASPSGNTTVTDSAPTNTDVVQDTEHTITVKAPEGASVYLNGNLQGVAPCSFTKQIGQVTLSLSQEGFVTKSYLVEIANDDQNITWSFPALTSQ